MIDTCKELPQAAPRSRLPPWLKRPIVSSQGTHEVERSISDGDLHTVCAEASCPNRGECFARGTATFLILGNICTRNCGFCGIAHGSPQILDKDEPRRVADAVLRMGITHAVITSVTRDDLSDGGASQFSEVIRRIHRGMPGVTVEVLVPDFAGNPAALDAVCAANPDVFNHNIETVPRLYPHVLAAGRLPPVAGNPCDGSAKRCTIEG